jgi:hypothetical protein
MFHLHFMLLLEIFNLAKGVIIKIGKVLLPVIKEILQLCVTNLDIFSKLSNLNICSEVFLVKYDILLKLANFSH